MNYLLQLDRLLTRYLDSLRVNSILRSFPLLSYFKRIGRADVMSKWVTIAIQRAEKSNDAEDLQYIRGEAGICLYNLGWHREAYAIVS